MQKIILITILLLTFSFKAQADQALMAWNLPQGLETLQHSKYKNDFYQIVNFYQPQINPLYCGVASSVIVLNALEYGKIANQKELATQLPESVGGGEVPYNLYSQINFLNDKTDKIKSRQVIEFRQKNAKGEYDAGISLMDLRDILSQAYKMHVKINYVGKNGEKYVAKFRQDLRKYLAEDKNFIVANFDGKVLGSKTGGHFSPLVAYDEESDLVLILDVALHKQNWYFVSAAKLYEAMNTKDADHYRGYLVIAK